jgi:DNA-directed RNA polymerase subunit RPC12/RpoP
VEVQSLSCNNCGAPIDVPANTNYATCGHCGSRLVIKRTDNAAYTEVLSRIDERTGQMSEDLAEIRAQNELEQVDREWQIEREQYLEHNKDGSTSVPSTGRTVLMLVGAGVAVLFACFWISTATSMTRSSGSFGGRSGSPLSSGPPSADSIFPMFGVLIILVVVVGVIVSLVNAGKYSEAEENYRNKRDAVIDRLKKKR